MNKADKSQKAETAFKLFDKNRDGYITREEFTKVFIYHIHIHILMKYTDHGTEIL